MSDPILLSDEEETPFQSKKRRTSPEPNPNPNPNPIPMVVLLDGDPTPRKPVPTSIPTFVPETPMSDLVIVKCSTKFNSDHKFSDSGINRFICLESDNESEGGSERGNPVDNETMDSDFDVMNVLDWSTKCVESTSTFGHVNATHMSEDSFLGPTCLQDGIPQCDDDFQASESLGKENIGVDRTQEISQKKTTNASTEKKNSTTEATRRKKMTEEESFRLKEEKKLRKLQEKLQKEALKAEVAELKKIEKEKKKWENGKFAIQSIVAEIDAKVIEIGSVGGNLLTRFSEKGLKYRITSNPIEKTILWTMKYPEHISEITTPG
ncbi:hypothetical protein L484_006718 [Morus notabilis]|uniref:Crossover junction endonuclease EME1B n=1 Tax=Morus notabilis TaxID=981085 RepID=W9R1U3_9ROSA|nr:hypothetical protein L484_006718 [Morus notabilis]